MLHDRADPGHPGQGEGDVGQDAHGHDRADPRPAEPLPQHEGVLGADRDDERQAGEQTGDGGVEHDPDARGLDHGEGKRKLLMIL